MLLLNDNLCRLVELCGVTRGNDTRGELSAGQRSGEKRSRIQVHVAEAEARDSVHSVYEGDTCFLYLQNSFVKREICFLLSF